MCTAISYIGKRHYFGRNLDLEYHYTEQVLVTPRKFPFDFRNGTLLPQHFAMIGMATVIDGYPLYYEATNECGLSMAGLNFPGNAVYHPENKDSDNVAPFELIPWLLGQCKSVTEAEKLLQRTSIWMEAFHPKLPPSPLHWLISDCSRSIVLESMADGMHIYDNPLGVLTNNPPFPYHMLHLSDFSRLTPGDIDLPEGLTRYSNGMGAIGLPGDFSSASRFVRCAFVKEHSMAQDDDISEFFHLLASVSMPSGSVLVQGKPEITRYSSCCDTAAGIYYYRTYNNLRITAVRMHSCPLDSCRLFAFDLRETNDIYFEN